MPPPEHGSYELARLYHHDIDLLAHLISTNHIPPVLSKMGEPAAAQAFQILQAQLDELGLLQYVNRRVLELTAPPSESNIFASEIAGIDSPTRYVPSQPSIPPQNLQKFLRQPRKPWNKPNRDEQWYQAAYQKLTDLVNCPVIDVDLHPIRSGGKRGWDIKTNNEGKNVVYRFVCGCSCYVDYDYIANWRPCGTDVCIHPENMFDPLPPPFRR